jgi:hypothetical protein
MSEGLTSPESSAERMARRRVLTELLACGGCAKCRFRDKAVYFWGRSICSVSDRKFPACVRDGRAPAFEFDDRGQ